MVIHPSLFDLFCPKDLLLAFCDILRIQGSFFDPNEASESWFRDGDNGVGVF